LRLYLVQFSIALRVRQSARSSKTENLKICILNVYNMIGHLRSSFDHV